VASEQFSVKAANNFHSTRNLSRISKANFNPLQLEKIT